MLEKIIYISGVARSGTSWIGQVLNSSPETTYRFQPFFAYEFKNQVNEDSLGEEFNAIFKEMIETESEFLTQKDKIESGLYPCFKKTKNKNVLVIKENRYQSYIEPILRKTQKTSLLGVVRNPCAVINSWRRNKKEFPEGSVLRDEWRFANCKNLNNGDYFGYYKWKEVANLYLDLKDKYKSRVFIVRYEDIVGNPVQLTRELFEFFELNFQKQTEEFLDKSTTSHHKNYYSVYKNKQVIEQWKDELDPYIINEIYDDLKNTRLEVFI